jgi:PadR family transcriptional regulator PadR
MDTQRSRAVPERDSNLQLIRGTVDVLILKALVWGPRHGYAISQWIKRVTQDALLIEEGSLYPALHRIARKGWIKSRWGVSDTGRRARFYELTEEGSGQLAREVKRWRLYVGAIERALSAPTEDTV